MRNGLRFLSEDFIYVNQVIFLVNFTKIVLFSIEVKHLEEMLRVGWRTYCPSDFFFFFLFLAKGRGEKYVVEWLEGDPR